MSGVGAPTAAPALAKVKVGCLRAGDCAGALYLLTKLGKLVT